MLKQLIGSQFKSWPETIFQILNLTFDPLFNVKWGHRTLKVLYLAYISIITDRKVGDKYWSISLV